MHSFSRLRFALAGIALGLALALAAPASAPEAATPNYAAGVYEVQALPIFISGQRTASVTAVTKFNLPFAARLIGVSSTARASGGTTPTLTVDVLEAGTTVLSAPIAITAGTVAEGTITDSAIADEGAITINLAIGGSSPTWDDITVILTVVRQ